MEIEERAFVESFQKVAEKLSKRGYKEKELVEIRDLYFCRESDSCMEDIQMDEPGSYGLRIREMPEKTELNCKVIRNRNDHNAFIEHETAIDSAEETQNILEAVGFKNFCTIQKNRRKFVSPGGEVTVNLEDLEDFPPVIEIEIVSEEDIEGKKKFIRQLLYDLDVEDEDIIEKSITLLYFRQNAFPN